MNLDFPRDGAGRFARLVCVNAHDRCYEGGPCPWCEPASVGRSAKRQDAEERLGPKDEHAVAGDSRTDAQTPSSSNPDTNNG